MMRQEETGLTARHMHAYRLSRGCLPRILQHLGNRTLLWISALALDRRTTLYLPRRAGWTYIVEKYLHLLQ
jgi:hypothetical protein